MDKRFKTGSVVTQDQTIRLEDLTEGRLFDGEIQIERISKRYSNKGREYMETLSELPVHLILRGDSSQGIIKKTYVINNHEGVVLNLDVIHEIAIRKYETDYPNLVEHMDWEI